MRKTGIKLVKIKFALQRSGGGGAVVVSSINCSINKRVDATLFFGAEVRASHSIDFVQRRGEKGGRGRSGIALLPGRQC